ncbi:MAG: hypothetical protein DVB23_002858 [Verrucomicrobia bacterium]|jgi:hypothetical protein|nr:MAG: hypothetical protein DVB23_002858 [Verrucomicrobiota bacterium]
MIDGRKNWRDEFSYDSYGVCAGWVRTLGGAKQEFAPDGRISVKRDSSGKILEVKTITYALRPGGADGKEPPEVVPKASDEVVNYD